MSDTPALRTILGLLADPGRRRVVTALLLGAETVGAIAAGRGTPGAEVTRAIETS